MSLKFKLQNDLDHNPNSSDKVRVTDLIFRLNEEKKIEKKIEKQEKNKNLLFHNISHRNCPIFDHPPFPPDHYWPTLLGSYDVVRSMWW